jgi:hypothetical protein
MKNSKVTIGTMTMNAGLGISGSTIRWALKHNFNNFEKIVVVDGDLTDDAKEFYSQFSNVQVIDSPWKDSYVTQYEKFAETLADGEWGLWLDDDEICSLELLGYLNSEDFESAKKRCNIIQLPCVLHITEDGQDYYAVEPEPSRIYTKNQWTKNILFRKDKGLYFKFFGSHVIPNNKNSKCQYVSAPYYHMKSFESFVYNDVWQAFLSPEGQNYDSVESSKFKMFTRCFPTTKDFKKATKKGVWPPTLKKFAWDHRREYDRPISRLSWVYFVLEGNLMPEVDEFMDWKNIKHHVLSSQSMRLFEENVKLGNFIRI